ncbi:DoxX family protein [Oceanobacillus caeni]|uniref:DoxX family protein n=1 Tax=Oceanobacillus caeni TaxID=405946 RepID=UPI000621B8F3|nr:DoxX family protein [Oceanobacillus caeni]KKE78289.1 hypothetical protein WH51_13470 [Bacilli bacterium VT-13-104]PZD84881.1 DoxX family protein [Bacilli bacterium]MCR1833725.1 DoxX family protein [Oceanobacillus caeni]PZD86348.1 DoxX family protein [Bacilli bacterium]PZD89862.1 DoxX family protein [Bacilli bacterium]
MQMTRWVCYAIGYVFITSGVIKLINGDFKIIFANLGIPYPELLLFLVAIAEIVCGTLICARMYIRKATSILIVIMLAAVLLTKLPLLSSGAFLHFLFEARLDFVMLLLLLAVYKYN